MRASWLREGASLIALLGLTAFCFFDEEPLFDASDWNGLHCVLLLFSVMAVVWENVTRARYGQFVYKDQVLLFATFSFWFFLENYTRIIIIVFCIHSLIPLEAELFELVEVYQTLTRWVSSSILLPLCILTLTLFMALALNLTIGWGRQALLILLSSGVCVSLLLNILLMGWDLAFAGLSSMGWFTDIQPFYLQSKSTLTQDHYLNVQDQYDWHRDRVTPFVMRFEDLFVFFLQLFNLASLFFCLIVWLSLSIDLVQLGQHGVSYTYVGVGIRWLEHCLFNFSIGHVALFLVGLRVSLRTPFEFWFLV